MMIDEPIALQIHASRKLTVAKNLRRLIQENADIRTLAKFSELHGSDVRTVKSWVKLGIDKLTTISEVAETLGVSDLELLLSEDEEKSITSYTTGAAVS